MLGFEAENSDFNWKAGCSGGRWTGVLECRLVGVWSPASFMEQREEVGVEVKLKGHKSYKTSPGLASTGEGICYFFFFCSHLEVGSI